MPRKLLRQKSSQPRLDARRLFQLAFPNGHDVPSRPAQLPDVGAIADCISFELGEPVALACRWPVAPSSAGMPVPETPVNKNDLSKAPEYQIGLTRQIRGMQTVTKAHGVNHASNRHFRSRISSMDAGHLSAAFGGAQFVHSVYRAAIQVFTCLLKRSSGRVPSRNTAS